MERLIFGKENPPNIPAGETVNTFRLGDKWFNKLNPGQMVELALFPGDQDEHVIGHAIVIDLTLGPFDQVCTLADENQTWRHLPYEDAVTQLEAELVKVYGPFDPAKDEISVVSYIRVLEE